MSEDKNPEGIGATPPILVAATQVALDLASDLLAQDAEAAAVRDGAAIDRPADAVSAALSLIEADLLATAREHESGLRRDEPPHSSHDEPDADAPRVSPGLADLEALRRVLGHVPRRSEQPDDRLDDYLDLVIGKPWGYEYRVYDDALLDAWLVTMRAGTRSSLHAHVRKDTTLLCLEGRGSLTTSSGRMMVLGPQTIVDICRGAAYRIESLTGVRLVMIDNPRDKFDLVRFSDDSGRAGRGYERAGYATGLSVPELTAAPSGPPRARLRPGDLEGRYRVSLETGATVRAAARASLFCVSLDIRTILCRDLKILRTDETDRADPEQWYLTIREGTSR